MNVDASEIEKFNQLARDFWDPSGPMGALHRVNPVRIDWIERAAGPAGLAGLKVLDIGCGGGLASEAMALRGAQVTAVDQAEKLLMAAKIHAQDAGAEVDYQQASVEAFCQAHEGQYDLVTCLEMIEHVPDPASIVAAAAQAVKPGGTLVLSTLNRSVKGFALGIVAAEYLLRWVQPGTHRWDKFIKPSELAGWIRRNQCTLVDSAGIVYNPLTQTFGIHPTDLDVNYLMSARKVA
ncbi:MAG: bifunctional 2-polyprenyl-6-hydroxyphenol methylase/3-demethylubiquinol 3-O-methyltransferase UbiG [Litorivicinus sp.]